MESRIIACVALAALVAGCEARPINLVSPDLGLLMDVKQPISDKTILDAFTTRPAVKPGANVGVAYIPCDKRFPLMRTITPEERKAWETALKDDYFITDVVALSSVYAPSANYRDLRMLRRRAASLNCDLLVVYGVSYDFARAPNIMAFSYVTIIGCFIMPGDSIRAGAMAKVALIDVRTGYIYAIVEGTAERVAAVPVGWLYSGVPRLLESAATDAVGKARQSLIPVMERLRKDAMQITPPPPSTEQ